MLMLMAAFETRQKSAVLVLLGAVLVLLGVVLVMLGVVLVLLVAV